MIGIRQSGLAATCSRAGFALALVVASTLVATGCASPPQSVKTEVDPRLDGPQALAASVMENMGGRKAWKRLGCVSWNFMGGGRRHTWNKRTGDARIETDKELVLMNIETRTGRAWLEGQEVFGAELDAMLEKGYAWWVNDSYWMFMPYKLLDPGVKLEFVGTTPMKDGRAADVLGVTFDSVGLTPQNRYEVFVARDTGLIEQWSFYSDAEDTEPRFTSPWSGWEQFGSIMLATDHGRERDWEINVRPRPAKGAFSPPK